MKIPPLILLSALFSTYPSSAFEDLLKNATKLYKITKKFINVATDANTVESMVDEFNDKNSQVGSLMHNLMVEINDIGSKEEISYTFGFIRKLSLIFPRRAGVTKWTSAVKSAINLMNSIFVQFVVFYKDSVSAASWKTFAELNIHLSSEMEKFENLLFASSEVAYIHPGILPLLVNESSILHSTYCEQTSYIQTFLNNFFQAVIINEMKALTVSIYVSMIRYAEQEGWRQIIPSIVNNFRDRIMMYVNKFAYFMDIAPKELTACDPTDGSRIRDETYFEIERVKHISIFQYSSFFHRKDCYYAINANVVKYHSQQDSCSGDLSDCKYSGKLKVCHQKDSAQQYEWIETDSGSYGINIGKCPHGSLDLSGYIAGNCICKCKENENNWINMKSIMTHVADNMVVTGIRFIRRERVLHIQVKQGKLLADGWIDFDSQHWIPLSEKPKLMAITGKFNTFYLHDVILPEDEVAVGVQFSYDYNGFFISVTGQQFNFSTGQLLTYSFTYAPDLEDYNQLLFPRENSIHTNLTHTPDSNKNFIELETSNLEHDIGQSVLPLFDGVAVESHSPVGGIGIVHKGIDNYAGFISPRLFHLQYRKYLLKFIENVTHDGEFLDN